MTLVELALTTYTESKAMEAETAGEYAEAARREFLQAARDCAGRTLDAAAADLDWQYTPASDLPDRVEEARALLAPGGLAYLRYRADYDEEKFSFDLVQPRRADRVSPVTGLFNLGQLLSETDGTRPAAEGRDGEMPPPPGPLAGIEALESQAIRVAQLGRRLLAQHGDAGLTFQLASLFGHPDGECTAELQLRAASVEAAQKVATALGIELTTQVTSSIPDYVFRRADGSTTIDGTEVKLAAYTQLSDDEAQAWHAEQARTTGDECPQNVIDGDVGGHFFKKGALSDSPAACTYCGMKQPESGGA